MASADAASPGQAPGSTSSARSARVPGSAPTRRPGYEEARDQLADLVKRLEAGGLTLEQSLELWERGERLAAICEEWLDGARARLAAVTSPPTGGAGQAGGAIQADAASRAADAGKSDSDDEAARPF